MNLLMTSSRYAGTPMSTISKVWDGEGVQVCSFLEDGYRGEGVKVPGETCIPTGLYRLDPVHESKMAKRYYERFDWFRGLPGLTWAEDRPMDPFFDLLRVHPGHDHLDTRGCPLTASSFGKDGFGHYVARDSVAAFKEFCHRCYAVWDTVGDVRLRITDHEMRL